MLVLEASDAVGGRLCRYWFGGFTPEIPQQLIRSSLHISSPKENNHKDLGGEFVLLDESQKNVMQLLDQLGIGTEKVVHTI